MIMTFEIELRMFILSKIKVWQEMKRIKVKNFSPTRSYLKREVKLKCFRTNARLVTTKNSLQI
jgi:hypothetical protein